MTDKEFKMKLLVKFHGKVEALDEYKGYRDSTQMRFRCSHEEHDEIFIASAQNILRGKGCPFCNGTKKTKTMIKNILKIRSNGKVSLITDYNHRDYKFTDKLVFKCTEHGEFTDCLNNVLKYKSCCSKCAYEEGNKNRKDNTLDKIKNILKESNSNITIAEESYKGVNKDAIFICPTHGEFKRKPGKILYESRLSCPKCGMSHGELFIYDLLTKMNINVTLQKTFDDLKVERNLRFDFFLDDYNAVIEFDGKQHHDKNSKFYSEELERNDKIKSEYCKKNGIQMLRIKCSDTRKLKKQEEKIKKAILKMTSKESSTTIETTSK